MKCIVVTGGAGFLGSYCGDRSIAEGNELRCEDNLFAGRDQSVAIFQCLWFSYASTEWTSGIQF